MVAFIENLTLKDFLHSTADPVPADMAVTAEGRNSTTPFFQRSAPEIKTYRFLGQSKQCVCNIFQFQ
ncbi:MAG: hypothetical protein LKE85_11995 [Lachnospiraceae bacterium]|nr:hypothetical protein [Lachnospiraceae bacterium]